MAGFAKSIRPMIIKKSLLRLGKTWKGKICIKNSTPKILIYFVFNTCGIFYRIKHMLRYNASIHNITQLEIIPSLEDRNSLQKMMKGKSPMFGIRTSYYLIITGSKKKIKEEIDSSK